MPIRSSVGLLRLEDFWRVGGDHNPARLPPREPIIMTTKNSESMTLLGPSWPVLAGGVAKDGSAHAISRPSIKQITRPTRGWRVEIGGCIESFMEGLGMLIFNVQRAFRKTNAFLLLGFGRQVGTRLDMQNMFRAV